MSEQRRGRQTQKLDSDGFRVNWNRLSTIYESGQLDFVNYFYLNGWCTGYRNPYITSKEFAHCVAVIFTSATILGAGIGQLVAGFF